MHSTVFCYMLLLELHFSTIFLSTENLVVSLILIQRNGNEYMTISDMSVSTDVSHFKMNFQYRNVASAIANMVTGLTNSNWKIMKPIMDPSLNRFISGMLQKSVLETMFNKFSVQEFSNEIFHGNCAD